MPIDPGRVKAFFLAAIERGDPDDRGAFLAAEAGSDPQLRAGYEGMSRSAAAIPIVDTPRLAEALDRLIAAGEPAGTKAELAAWKAERAKLGAGATKP